MRNIKCLRGKVKMNLIFKKILYLQPVTQLNIIQLQIGAKRIPEG